MEKTLEIEPDILFDAAGRHDTIATKVFKNDRARQLMRSLEPLTEDEFARVLKMAQTLAKKYHPEES